MNQINIVYKISYHLLTLFCLSLVALPSTSGHSLLNTKNDKQEFTKTVKKEVAITPSGLLNVQNKYGEVNVHTWGKDRVRITATIIVDTKSENKAQEIFDRIQIDITNSSSKISAITNIESSNSWKGWEMGNADYQINYEVLVPLSLNVDIYNKYGNVLIEKITGDVTIDVKYGNFQVNGAGSNANITLGYGNGTLFSADNVKADVKYSQLALESVGDLDMETKYSKVRIGRAANIQSISKYDNYKIKEAVSISNYGKYDDFTIEKIQSIKFDTKYTNIKVVEVDDRVKLDMKYGGARLEQVNPNFSEIRIDGDYADFKINMHPAATFSLKADADYAGISYPEGLKIVREHEDGSEHSVEGKNSNSPKGVVFASLDYGGLRIK